mgnify:CR=1 FL=1
MKQKRKQLPEKQQPADGKLLQWHPAFYADLQIEFREKNLWLYSLTDTLKDMSVTRQLLEDYKKNKEDQLYQAVMEIIVKANENRLKEGKRDMCNALLELMKDELDEKREEGIREGIKEGESLGESRINQLNLKLSELSRSDEILKAAVDREYQKKLLKEFGL